jgi:indole-3-glycerol phosphate synthase
LELALEAEATLVGVNQRDLVTFQVDHERAERMAGVIPTTAVRVAESGVRDAADARRLEAAGYDAVLVGETLVTSGDPARAIRALLGG